MDHNFQCKVGDFGSSRFGDPKESSGTVLKGTFAYAAPENYYKSEKITPAADVYSLAIVLWEMVNRLWKGVYEPPFSEFDKITQPFQILFQTAKFNLRPTLPNNCPLRLKNLIEKCWSGSPSLRPDGKQLLEELLFLQRNYEANPVAYPIPLKKKKF